MLKKVLTFILFTISINSVFAFTYYDYKAEVKVGISPNNIFKIDDNGFYVVCLGQDLDFDFNYDDGDEYPSLWYVSYNKDNDKYSSEKVFTFNDFTNYLPIRVAVDKVGHILYMPLLSGIVSISLDDYSVIDDNISNISANGLEYIAGHLLVSSNDDNSNGQLSVINLSNNQVLQTIKIGTNLMNCIYYQGDQGISIAALTVGPFGESQSKLYYGAIDHKFDFALSDSILLGDTGNDIAYSNGRIFATVNFSNIVKGVDLESKEVRSFNLGTTGYNGPRDLKVVDGKLYVTTYAEDFRIFDIETGALESIINSKNNLHLEGLEQLDNNTIAVAGIYNSDYSASNIVEIYETSTYKNTYSTFDVGYVPLWVANLDGTINVICNGLDSNKNGIFDDGDENPSWWIIKDNQTIKKFEFEFNSFNLPFIPAIDKDNKLIYIAHKDVIKSYSYENYNVEDNDVANINATALDFAGGHLLVVKNNSENKDSIYVINLVSGMVLQKLNGFGKVSNLKYYTDPKGIGLAFSYYDNSDNKYYLNYGPIGHMVDFKLENLIEIDNPFQLLFTDNKLISLSANKGTVTMVDINTNEVNQYNLATNYVMNGPTSVIYHNNNLYACTINSDYRIYNTKTDELETIIPLSGKCNFINNISESDLNLAICSGFDNDFNYNNKVLITNDLPTSVNDKISYDNLKIYPNPSTDFIKLEGNILSSNEINIKIYNMSGKLIKEQTLPSNELINVKDLSAGSYMILINSDNNFYNLPFNIVR